MQTLIKKLTLLLIIALTFIGCENANDDDDDDSNVIVTENPFLGSWVFLPSGDCPQVTSFHEDGRFEIKENEEIMAGNFSAETVGEHRYTITLNFTDFNDAPDCRKLILSEEDKADLINNPQTHYFQVSTDQTFLARMPSPDSEYAAIVFQREGTSNDAGDFGAGAAGNPIEVSIGESTQSIPAFGTRYYRFTTTDSGGYALSLKDTVSDFGWALYADALRSRVIFICDEHDDSTDESCSVSLAADTTYYFQVDEFDSVEGSFTFSLSKN